MDTSTEPADLDHDQKQDHLRVVVNGTSAAISFMRDLLLEKLEVLFFKFYYVNIQQVSLSVFHQPNKLLDTHFCVNVHKNQKWPVYVHKGNEKSVWWRQVGDTLDNFCYFSHDGRIDQFFPSTSENCVSFSSPLCPSLHHSTCLVA